jgi:hypothetical protein
VVVETGIPHSFQFVFISPGNGINRHICLKFMVSREHVFSRLLSVTNVRASKGPCAFDPECGKRNQLETPDTQKSTNRANLPNRA